MSAFDRLTDVFDLGLRDGIDSLSPEERELYFIQEFILDYEMDGLSGYFYNRLPDLQCIRQTIAAMRQRRMLKLAALLAEGVAIFQDYIDPDPPSTWKQDLKKYDPENRLHSLGQLIDGLDNYDMDNAQFS